MRWLDLTEAWYMGDDERNYSEIAVSVHARTASVHRSDTHRYDDFAPLVDEFSGCDKILTVITATSPSMAFEPFTATL